MSLVIEKIRFPILLLGTYVSFLLWGYYQERVVAYPYYTEFGAREYFHYSVFLNVVQAVMASLLAVLFMLVTKTEFIRFKGDGLVKLMGVSFSHTLASPFGYYGLKFVNYPTYILAKSCKLLPVILIQFLFFKKRFPTIKLVAIALITIGVILFTLLKDLEKEGAHKSNSFMGLFLIFINLTLDGFSNATQDALTKKYTGDSISWNLMFYINLVSVVYMSLYMSAGPGKLELVNAMLFIERHPSILANIVLFGVSGAIGQVFIYQMLKHYGSVVLVTVNITRKLFSVIISNVMYQHGINFSQWLSVALVFFGIFIESHFKHSPPPSVTAKDKKKA